MSLATTVFFETSSGRRPVLDFIEALNARDSAATLAAIVAFAREFPEVVSVAIKPLKGKLWEMKVGRFRILYGVAGGTLLVVHVFTKKTQKTPAQDLALGATRLRAMTEEQQ